MKGHAVWKTAILAFSILSIAILQSSTTEARGIIIRYGWGAELNTIGDVGKDSLAGREMGDKRLSIAQKWDQLWLAVPLWCSGRKYVMHERVDAITDETLIWELKEQSPEMIAKITGIPQSQLPFPFYAYIPFGWLIIGGVSLFVRLISGRSPKKEFSRLMLDDRYKQALAILATPIAANTTATEHDLEVTDEDQKAEIQNHFVGAVNYLTSQGVSKSKAENNLEFLIGYVNSHPGCVI